MTDTDKKSRLLDAKLKEVQSFASAYLAPGAKHHGRKPDARSGKREPNALDAVGETLQAHSPEAAIEKAVAQSIIQGLRLAFRLTAEDVIEEMKAIDAGAELVESAPLPAGEVARDVLNVEAIEVSVLEVRERLPEAQGIRRLR